MGNFGLYSTIAAGSFAAGFWKQYTGADGFFPNALLVGTPLAGGLLGMMAGPSNEPYRSSNESTIGLEIVLRGGEAAGHGVVGFSLALGSELVGMLAAYAAQKL